MILKTVQYICSDDVSFPNVSRSPEMKGATVTILYFYYITNEVKAGLAVNCV